MKPRMLTLHTTRNGSHSQHTFKAPDYIPKGGETYVVMKAFGTRGGELYNIGDKLKIIARVMEAPHGELLDIGNLLVQGKDRKFSIWSTIELSVNDGLFHLQGSST